MFRCQSQTLSKVAGHFPHHAGHIRSRWFFGIFEGFDGILEAGRRYRFLCFVITFLFAVSAIIKGPRFECNHGGSGFLLWEFRLTACQRILGFSMVAPIVQVIAATIVHMAAAAKVQVAAAAAIVHMATAAMIQVTAAAIVHMTAAVALAQVVTIIMIAPCLDSVDVAIGVGVFIAVFIHQ